MAISCAYCHGEHDSPAQVRQCWRDGGEQDVAIDDAPLPDPAQSSPVASPPSSDRRPPSPGRAPVARSTPALAIERGVATAGPGPDELGRNVVVDAGGSIPDAWVSAQRLVIDASVLEQPTATLDRLRAAAHARERLVIELAVPFEREPMLMTDAAPHDLGPTFLFHLETLHQLVWANGVDARNSERPVWIGLDTAVAAGATVAGDAVGDVVLADGTPVWIDGGPVRHIDPIDGVPVVHVVAVEHGSLAVPAANVSNADLAPDQLAAVTHPGGGARIIAPAGSGKTRVLTERARHLLTRWNLPPSAVSLVAFNKRAQEEMLERTTDLPGLQVRTLNAIALAIVNGTPPFAPQERRWQTIDEPAVRRVIADLVDFPRRRNSDPIGPWIEALTVIRLGLVAPEEVESRYDGDVDGLAAVWPSYRAALERRGAVDFDDQIYRALLVLLREPAARRQAQRACRIMLVDEFQDLTPAHLLLVRLLSSPGAAVFGVGDDDQTIYGYNGADPAWLIDFAQLFPGAGEHPLEVNYRCPSGVVDVADRLLRHNRRRVPKVIRASSDDPGGVRIDSSVDAVSATRRAVHDALAGSAAATDIAVLSRVNALLAPVQVALAIEGIPISGGVGLEFADRTSVRTVLAWLRLAVGRGALAADDIREALRRPSRSFHPRITDWVAEQSSVVDLNRLAGRLNNDRDAERVIDFAADVQALQQAVAKGATTSDVVLQLIDEIGLAGSVATLDANRRGMNRAAQGDDLTAVSHLAALHDDPATFERWLRSHLATKRSADGVLLSTVHRVKGQEWPHVIVHLADAEQYPHRLAEDVEEERRLFHVAITRASREATIVTGARPSPFVAELTTEPSADRPVVSSHRPEPVAKRAASAVDPSGDLDPAGQQRFAALRDLRNELRDGKPAYVVFDNKTLAAIAAAAPTTARDLGRISGVGPAKLERYGDAVVELMARMTAG
ncbi:MAG TPA: UvrD-helicase domain-containing protein [Ilumatobacteraceae bacterium]|nr:UvrD-helicase domain-containing protein [Ilumatobacteraceae bacterium]